jgi:hypothetical protein
MARRGSALIPALGLLALLLLPALSDCVVEKDEPAERAVIEPSYAFTLGSEQSDIMAALGMPAEGPRFDRVSQTIEVVYRYPFPAIQTESHFPNGVTRSEMVDTLHLFFDRKGLLVRMGSWVDRWYSSVVEMPVQRVTVLPRVVHYPSGEITAPRVPQ